MPFMLLLATGDTIAYLQQDVCSGVEKGHPFMADPLKDPSTVRMSARIWAGIDAGIDNAVSLAAVNGDEEAVRVGRAIRAAGREQVPWVNGSWPPMDRIISIRLTRARWRFAADEARKSIPVYEELDDEESARLGRNALAVIEAAGL